MQISLLVIRCKNIEKNKIFYESLGLLFQKEKHGDGLEHYSCEDNHVVFELYSNAGVSPNDNVRLGFKVKNLDEIIKNLEIDSSYEFSGKRVYIVVDPDGRKVELS